MSAELKPYTVIVSEHYNDASATYYHVVAFDAKTAGELAANLLYVEQHSNWTQEDLQDDPFLPENFNVMYVFPGHLNNEAAK